MVAPWPPLRRPRGIHGARQVSWLAAYRRRRLPGRKQAQWREKRRHAAHSRGGGHGSAKGLPCSLFTLGQDRGTVRDLCPSFAKGCQTGALQRVAVLASPSSLRRGAHRGPHPEAPFAEGKGPRRMRGVAYDPAADLAVTAKFASRLRMADKLNSKMECLES